MSFVIVGAGRVGLRTARVLRQEGYEVVVVENDPEKIERLENENARVVEGDGAQADALEEAGIETASAIGGLTGNLNTNFAACMIGNEYGCRTVLRIDEDYRKAVYEKYADQVDEVIYPEQLGATGAKTALLGGTFNVLADLTEELRLLTIKIPDDSPVIGRRVRDLSDLIDVTHARIYAHGRKQEPMTIPLPGTDIEPNDRVAVIADRGSVEEVRSKLLGETAGAEA